MSGKSKQAGPSKRPDRRVGRTRSALREALLELIEERPYDRITIGDLTRRANVGRSTFYSHFASKEDLLFSGFGAWLDSLAGPEGASGRVSRGDRLRFSRPLLEHVQSTKRFFRAVMVDASHADIRRRSSEILARVVRRELGCEAGDRAAEARVQCTVGAFFEVAAWWLRDAPDLGVAAVDEAFQAVCGGRGAEAPGTVAEGG